MCVCVCVCVRVCLCVCVFVSPCYDDAIPIMHFVQYPIIYTYLSIESIYII